MEIFVQITETLVKATINTYGYNANMKYVFLLTLLTTLTAGMSNEGCKDLRPGRYITLLDQQFTHYGPLELTIEGNNALVKSFHMTKSYKIVSDGLCRYRFIDLSPDSSTHNEILRQIATLGTPYFQIDHRDKDTLVFVFRRNAHIMMYSGKFIYSGKRKRQQ